MKNNKPKFLNKLATLSIIVSIVLVIFTMITVHEINQVSKDYNETMQEFNDLSKKYDNLVVKQKDLRDNHQKLLKKSKKKVYLTFDDGSSQNTAKIFDILAKYDVKATFFVVGLSKDEGYKKVEDEAYQKIVNAGHTIALHSNRHDYEMYYNPQDFIKDLKAIHARVLKATGLDVKDIRLAGGSSNSFVSPSNLKKINNYLNKNDYRYYDWNCDSNDGLSNSRTKASVLKSATSCSGDKIVLLMHDSIGKTSTVSALPEIIEYYQKKGYVFDVIDREAPSFQHRPQK